MPPAPWHKLTETTDKEVAVFVQVLRGRATDNAGLMHQLERWPQELAAGAEGWLGSTAGITEEGRFIGSFRFETQELAQRNSDRKDQTEWWNETSRYLDTPRFWDCSLVQVYRNGGSDDAGFVQVIQGRVIDPEDYRERSMSMGDTPRDDVIGGVIAWDGSRFTEFVYFTSEEEARAGERAPGHTTALERVWPLTGDIDYFDLLHPWLASP